MPTTFVVTITKADGYVFRHEVAAHRLVEFLRNYAEVVQLNETLTVSEA
jgi:hypothetical protein